MRIFRSFFFVPFVFSALGLACGARVSTADATGASSGSPNGDPTSNPDEAPKVACPAEAPPACGAPTDVATSEAFLEALLGSGAPFVDETMNPASGAALRPSRDLRATVDLEVSADDLRALWNPCASEPDGGGRFRTCVPPSFVPEHPVHIGQTFGAAYYLDRLVFPSGVSCAERTDKAVDPRALCVRLRIAQGTVFRLQRAETRFYFGSQHAFEVRLVRACATPCAEEEVRCGATDTCFRAGVDSCRLCEGGSGEACSCRSGCGSKPAGATCSYDTSDDTTGAGTCTASGACDGAR